MILSDREIRAAIARDALRITPEPRPEAWSSTAVDLTLGPELKRWNVSSGGGIKMEFNPADPEFDFHALNARFSERIEIPAEGYALAPGSFILAWTIEKIRLPHRSRLAARVEGRKSGTSARSPSASCPACRSAS